MRINAVFFEILGQSRGLMANFERKMFDTEPHNLSLRIGWGTGWSIPQTASYLLGRDHKLESSVGWLYQLGTKRYTRPSILSSDLEMYDVRTSWTDQGWILRCYFRRFRQRQMSEKTVQSAWEGPTATNTTTF